MFYGLFKVKVENVNNFCGMPDIFCGKQQILGPSLRRKEDLRVGPPNYRACVGLKLSNEITGGDLPLLSEKSATIRESNHGSVYVRSIMRSRANYVPKS